MSKEYTPLITEIFKKASNGNVKQKKIDALRKYDSEGLRRICKAAYDTNIEWLLPEGNVPYVQNEAPEGTEHTRLVSQARLLSNFVKGGPNMPQYKRENVFIQLLEGLHKDEAEFLVLVKDQSVHTKYKVSAPVIKEAFGWDDNFMKKREETEEVA